MASSRPVLAQDYAAAGRHFAAAQDAFAQGNYKEAAQQYQASYDITQDPALLFNIGESWQRAGDLGRARDSYQAYLKAQPSAADRAEVEQRLKAIEAAAPPAPAVTAPAACKNARRFMVCLVMGASSVGTKKTRSKPVRTDRFLRALPAAPAL